MPNVDFERKLLASRLANVIDSADFERKLLTLKALVDYQDSDILRLNFMDTFRPELWCLDGLARHLAPLPDRQYGLNLLESLPRIPASFVPLPREKIAWVLYVELDPAQVSIDDGYFFKKVKDQIGFGSSQNIDLAILPGMARDISISTAATDDESETVPPLLLTPGMNTVIFTARDQRISAWLFFAFLCNYLDRGYKLHGYASSIPEKGIFAKWLPFTLTTRYIAGTFGFQPDPDRFQAALRSQHYQTYYEAAAQTWHIAPPIFRLDIIHPVDILEDYLVVTHYDEVKPTPLISVPALGLQTKRSALEEQLIACMQAHGARQTIGLFLDSHENLVESMRHDAPERLIRLANAVNKNREYLVDSSLPPLLRNAAHPSVPLPPTTFYLFTETASLDANRVAHSRWKMGILLVGTGHPFNNAHTLLDALCHHLCLNYTLKRSANHALIPGRQMNVFIADILTGQFGEVHPEVLTHWELFYPASFIELDLDSLVALWSKDKIGM